MGSSSDTGDIERLEMNSSLEVRRATSSGVTMHTSQILLPVSTDELELGHRIGLSWAAAPAEHRWPFSKGLVKAVRGSACPVRHRHRRP